LIAAVIIAKSEKRFVLQRYANVDALMKKAPAENSLPGLSG
jgi:hypothetical protein